MTGRFKSAPRTTLGFYERRYHPYSGRASVFTALGGQETGLTKGLAAVLASDPLALAALIQLPAIIALLGAANVRTLLEETLTVSVQAEELQANGLRRDVVVRFFTAHGHEMTLMIEAKAQKSASNARSSASLFSQLQAYLAGSSAFDSPGDQRVGVTLTRVRSLASGSDLASITWTDLVQICLAQGTGAARDFGEHLLRTSGLRYYEIEVYSVPAGDSIALIWQFGLHAEPADRHPRAALYLAPREAAGGRIRELYRIRNFFDLDLDQQLSELARLQQADPNLAQRVRTYLQARRAIWPAEAGVIRFYDLETPGIPLAHAPRPRRNPRGAVTFWTIAHLLDASRGLLPSRTEVP